MGADSAARRLRAATVVLAAQVALAATAPTRGEKADEHEERHQGNDDDDHVDGVREPVHHKGGDGETHAKGGDDAENRAVNTLVDTVVLAEDLTAGESVQEFRIYANLPQFPRSKRICVYHGDTIGHKCICRFPAMYTGQLSVEVLRSNGDWRIASMQAFYAAGEKA